MFNFHYKVILTIHLNVIILKKDEIQNTRPHDHKLRKYLSLKLDSYYLGFFFLVLISCIYKQHIHLKTISNFWFIIKTISNFITVWNFDLRMISVYGRGAWKGSCSLKQRGLLNSGSLSKHFATGEFLVNLEIVRRTETDYIGRYIFLMSYLPMNLQAR